MLQCDLVWRVAAGQSKLRRGRQEVPISQQMNQLETGESSDLPTPGKVKCVLRGKYYFRVILIVLSKMSFTISCDHKIKILHFLSKKPLTLSQKTIFDFNFN